MATSSKSAPRVMSQPNPLLTARRSDEERLKVLDHAWKIGCTHWDTADCYGDSEDVVGKWFRLHPERRQDIFLATKFALTVVEEKADQELMNLGRNSSPEYCRASIESSLKRLGVDHVDLYYVHRVDRKTPIEKTMEALKQLKE
jgi:aryl-alcohol dehydrogenase-like predicted oxidoreductase